MRNWRFFGGHFYLHNVQEERQVYLSVKEVAQLTGRSEQQVYYSIEAGHLPARKIDNQWAIRARDIGPFRKKVLRFEFAKAEID